VRFYVVLMACAAATLALCWTIAAIMSGGPHDAKALENAYHPFSVETSVKDR